jgi:predicted phage-related endonuclease
MLQVRRQMLCSESAMAYVAVLDGSRLAFALYRVERDEGYAAEIEAKAAEFWERHVLADVPPDGAYTVATAARVNRVAGTLTHIPSEIVERYAIAREEATAADRRLDEAKAALLTSLGQADGGSGGGYRVRYALRGRESLDTKRLVAENPELAARYRTRTEFRVLDVRSEGARNEVGDHLDGGRERRSAQEEIPGYAEWIHRIDRQGSTHPKCIAT